MPEEGVLQQGKPRTTVTVESSSPYPSVRPQVEFSLRAVNMNTSLYAG